MRFTNNKQNVQIPVGPGLFTVNLGWSSDLSPQPAMAPTASGAATNAAAVTRGALLFGITLAEQKSVVKTWAPFNNTDFDLTTSDKWNYALDLSKPMTFKWASTGVPSMPFDHHSFPGSVYATARLASVSAPRRLLHAGCAPRRGRSTRVTSRRPLHEGVADKKKLY